MLLCGWSRFIADSIERGFIASVVENEVLYLGIFQRLKTLAISRASVFLPKCAVLNLRSFSRIVNTSLSDKISQFLSIFQRTLKSVFFEAFHMCKREFLLAFK